MEKQLVERSGNVCELCGSDAGLDAWTVPHSPVEGIEAQVVTCETCRSQLENPETVSPAHWRCLNDSMWSQVPAVQVTAWRMLDQLRGEGWPVDLLDMMYMEPETEAWAKAAKEASANAVIHKDAFGTILEKGDSIVLTKSLDVKGTNFTAKKGTVVRNISLVHDDAGQIEGRVNGQRIVILTQYVKKN